MGLFQRKRRDDDVPAGPDYRSPQLGLRAGDLQVLAALQDSGAQLDQPRHVRHFLYFRDGTRAEAAAEVARGHGFETVLGDPPDEGAEEWPLVCERHGVVLDPKTVRETSDLFEAIANLQRGEYDGWEASV